MHIPRSMKCRAPTRRKGSTGAGRHWPHPSLLGSAARQRPSASWAYRVLGFIGLRVYRVEGLGLQGFRGFIGFLVSAARKQAPCGTHKGLNVFHTSTVMSCRFSALINFHGLKNPMNLHDLKTFSSGELFCWSLKQGVRW